MDSATASCSRRSLGAVVLFAGSLLGCRGALLRGGGVSRRLMNAESLVCFEVLRDGDRFDGYMLSVL